MPPLLSDAEVLALPENGGVDNVVDPTTGHTSQVRRPVQFLVNDSDALFYRLADNSCWTVGRSVDGKLWRQRWA